MKKLFTVLPLIFNIYSFGQVQVITNDDFNQYTVGDFGTDTTGSIPSQGGYYLKNGTVSDYQILDHAGNGKALYFTTGDSYNSVTGVDPTNSNTRVIRKAIGPAASNNNVVLGSIDFFTGSANGKGELMFHLMGDPNVATYGPNGVVGISFDYATKKIIGYGKGSVAGPAAFAEIYTFNTVYPDNTWVHATFHYDKALGILKFTTPTQNVTLSNGIITGLIPVEMRILATTKSGNTVQNNVGIDNVSLKFTNNGEIALNTSEISTNKSDVTVYPNPVSDYAHIDSKEKIDSVELFDISGKLIHVSLKDNVVDLRNLKSGTYILSAKTKNKIILSQKIIKK